jgi:2,4-dichlorophenol 6-monooxygenase
MRLLEVPAALGTSNDREASRRSFAQVLGDARGRQGVAAAIQNQAEHFDMLGLQLGFRYEKGAIEPDGSDEPAVVNPVREFVPSSRPGSRLPHGWLERPMDTQRCSTLDLVPLERFTLFAGPDGQAWVDAARAIWPALGCVRIGSDVRDAGNWWSGVAKMQPDGALIVRPDQHVAFRSREGSPDPEDALARAVAAVLGVP